MEIFPISEVYYRSVDGEMVDTGLIIGYEARGYNGIVLGRGESIAEATDAALLAMYLPESDTKCLTNEKKGICSIVRKQAKYISNKSKVALSP